MTSRPIVATKFLVSGEGRTDVLAETERYKTEANRENPGFAKEILISRFTRNLQGKQFFLFSNILELLKIIFVDEENMWNNFCSFNLVGPNRNTYIYFDVDITLKEPINNEEDRMRLAIKLATAICKLLTFFFLKHFMVRPHWAVYQSCKSDKISFHLHSVYHYVKDGPEAIKQYIVKPFCEQVADWSQQSEENSFKRYSQLLFDPEHPSDIFDSSVYNNHGKFRLPFNRKPPKRDPITKKYLKQKQPKMVPLGLFSLDELREFPENYTNKIHLTIGCPQLERPDSIALNIPSSIQLHFPLSSSSSSSSSSSTKKKTIHKELQLPRPTSVQQTPTTITTTFEQKKELIDLIWQIVCAGVPTTKVSDSTIIYNLRNRQDPNTYYDDDSIIVLPIPTSIEEKGCLASGLSHPTNDLGKSQLVIRRNNYQGIHISPRCSRQTKCAKNGKWFWTIVKRSSSSPAYLEIHTTFMDRRTKEKNKSIKQLDIEVARLKSSIDIFLPSPRQEDEEKIENDEQRHHIVRLKKKNWPLDPLQGIENIQHLDYRKIQDTNQVPKFEFPSYCRSTKFIKAPPGSGKSEAVGAAIGQVMRSNTASFLAVGSRRSLLANNLGSMLRAIKSNKIPWSTITSNKLRNSPFEEELRTPINLPQMYSEDDAIEKAIRLFITIESLFLMMTSTGRINREPPTVLWLDEIVSLIKHMITSPTLQSRKRRLCCAAILEYYIKYSQHVVCTDADLDTKTIEWIQNLRQSSMTSVQPSVISPSVTVGQSPTTSSQSSNDDQFKNIIQAQKHTSLPIQAHFFHVTVPRNPKIYRIYRRVQHFDHRLIQDIKKGRCVYVSFDFLSEAKVYMKMIEKETDVRFGKDAVSATTSTPVGVLYSSEMSDETRNELFDCNLHWNKYRVIFATPTITYGSSYTGNKIWRVYAKLSGLTRDAPAAAQSLERIRMPAATKGAHVCLWISPIAPKSFDRKLPTKQEITQRVHQQVLDFEQIRRNKISSSSSCSSSSSSSDSNEEKKEHVEEVEINDFTNELDVANLVDSSDGLNMNGEMDLKIQQSYNQAFINVAYDRAIHQVDYRWWLLAYISHVGGIIYDDIQKTDIFAELPTITQAMKERQKDKLDHKREITTSEANDIFNARDISSEEFDEIKNTSSSSSSSSSLVEQHHVLKERYIIKYVYCLQNKDKFFNQDFIMKYGNNHERDKFLRLHLFAIQPAERVHPSSNMDAKHNLAEKLDKVTSIDKLINLLNIEVGKDFSVHPDDVVSPSELDTLTKLYKTHYSYLNHQSKQPTVTLGRKVATKTLSKHTRPCPALPSGRKVDRPTFTLGREVTRPTLPKDVRPRSALQQNTRLYWTQLLRNLIHNLLPSILSSERSRKRTKLHHDKQTRIYIRNYKWNLDFWRPLLNRLPNPNKLQDWARIPTFV